MTEHKAFSSQNYAKIRTVIFFAILIFVNLFVVNLIFVFGNSMAPTLHDKQVAVMLKCTKKYTSNDIIVTNTKNSLGTHLVKRVIAAEGDHLEISRNHVSLNGHVLEEPYLLEQAVYLKSVDLEIPPGMLFIMGDNRNQSIDSREIGLISTKDVLGKLILY